MPLLPADFTQPEPANNFAHNSGRDCGQMVKKMIESYEKSL